MSLQVQPSSTSQFVLVNMRSSTTGQLLTGIAYGSITVTYWRPGAAAPVAESSIIDGTLGSYNAKSWKEYSTTGQYQYCPSNAAIASGVPYVDLKFTASGALDKIERIWLQSVVTGIAPGADGGSWILGANTGNITITASSASSAALKITGAAKSGAGNGGNAIEIVGGAADSLALVTGNGGHAITLTGGASAASGDGLGGSVMVATGGASTGEVYSDPGSAIVDPETYELVASRNNPLTAAGTRTALGMASANLDTQLTAIDDYLDTELAAVKAKTDQLTFTVANVVDANATSGAGDATAANQTLILNQLQAKNRS